MKPPQYVSVPGGKDNNECKSGQNKATTCMTIVIFFYAFISIMRNIQADFIVFLPTSTNQRSQDGHIPFLPPVRDGSDLSLPSDLASTEAIIILEPTMGSHRYIDDAVFAVAEGIELEALALFVASLRDSGFEGDIVLSVLQREQMSTGVFDFLKYHSKRGLVFYEGAVEFEESPYKYNSSNTKVYLNGLYGDKTTRQNLEDSRKNRDISVARYELYWIWSRRYSPVSKILLIDAKDSYFQRSNETIGVGMACPDRNTWELHLYEGSLETRDVADKAMIPTAYNNEIYNILSKMKIIIPSSTHGDQVAIETYLRAMIKQFDYTQCAESACEWAWHNYLYYFGVLQGAPGIDNITLAMHGTGSVHIVSSNEILQNQYEVNETNRIYNPDKGILYNRQMGNGMGFGYYSPWAVHRYDQDPILKASIDIRAKSIVSDLYTDNTDQIKSSSIVQPSMGSHRKDVDAIFSVADDVSLEDLSLFLISSRKSGFDGDIVLSVTRRDRLRTGVYDLLESQIQYGLVVYEGVLSSQDDHFYSTSQVLINGFYIKSDGFEAQDDQRPARYWGVARYELFLAWSQRYSYFSKILLLQADDSYFQKNPFNEERACKKLELNFFMMSKLSMRFAEMELYYSEIYDAFQFLLEDEAEKLKNEKLLTPDAILGHSRPVIRYLQDMIKMVDHTKCFSYGCDWAVHNFMWYFNHTSDIQDHFSVTAHEQGRGVVNTIMSSVTMMTFKRILKDGELFLDWDFKPSAVVINFKSLKKMRSVFNWKKREYVSELGASMTRKFLKSSLSVNNIS